MNQVFFLCATNIQLRYEQIRFRLQQQLNNNWAWTKAILVLIPVVFKAFLLDHNVMNVCLRARACMCMAYVSFVYERYDHSFRLWVEETRKKKNQQPNVLHTGDSQQQRNISKKAHAYGKTINDFCFMLSILFFSLHSYYFSLVFEFIE